MTILESQLIHQDDKTLTIKLTNTRGTEYSLTVIKHPDYTVEQLVERWTNRAKREYIANRAMFKRVFIDRINDRHQKLVSGEISLTN